VVVFVVVIMGLGVGLWRQIRPSEMFSPPPLKVLSKVRVYSAQFKKEQHKNELLWDDTEAAVKEHELWASLVSLVFILISPIAFANATQCTRLSCIHNHNFQLNFKMAFVDSVLLNIV